MEEIHKIQYLLRRAGFGARPEELESYARKGLNATVDELVDCENIPEEFDSLQEFIGGELLDFNDPTDLKTWWLFRMIRTKRPLQEKMTLFWHGHFATSNGKVGNGALMQRQNDLFRRYALGRFPSLLLAVSKDPAMLIYLDGNSNRKAAPNENYGREVMELFTLGVGNYSEEDVKSAARAFTGWHTKDGEFYFNAKEHDDNVKTFFGLKDRYDGGDIVQMLAARPQTARFLARKLCRYFVCEESDTSIEKMLAEEYLRTGGDLREVLRKLFRSKQFYSDEFVGKKVKSPIELVVSAARSLHGKSPLRAVTRVASRLGQDLFYPPNVKGWDGGLAWLNSSTVVERVNLMKVLTSGANNQPSLLLEPTDFMAKYNVQTAPQAVDTALHVLGIHGIAPEIRMRLINYLNEKAGNMKEVFPHEAVVDFKVRGLFQLILCLPEYQLS